MRIPKIIHYCWFGGKTMPPLAVKCMDSWRKILPDYQLQLWDENSFDVNIHPYVKEAYEAKKFAFVTDYVRLYALYNFGGIYMDTDVEVVKKFDDLLDYPAFSGFEGDKYVPTGMMASEKNGLWVKELLDYYKGRNFRLGPDTFDTTTNTHIISGIMASNGFILKNSFQVYKDTVHIFPKDYFCAKSFGLVTTTENTYCIHHFAGSWNPLPKRIKLFLMRILLGGKIRYNLVMLKRKIKKTILSS